MCIKVLERTGLNIDKKLGIISRERWKRQCLGGWAGNVVLNNRFSGNVHLVFI